MNSDSAFYIGKTHDICEDYVLSNLNHIVLSDGCSGSPNTDVGSRLLCFKASCLFSTIDHAKNFREEQCLLETKPSAVLLSLPVECLDATLLIANHSSACIYGDGYIIIELKNGYKYIIVSEYKDNYPYYINYVYSHENRYTDWKENHNRKHVSLHGLSPEGKHEVLYVDSNSKESEVESTNEIIDIYYHPLKTVIDIKNKDQVKYIAISSDGLGSFYETVEEDTSRVNKPVSDIEIIKMLLSFKNFNGRFVQRRMNKFRKMCKKQNWNHADDISLGVIYIGD